MTDTDRHSQYSDGFENARERILAAALKLAPFDGWTSIMIDAAAQSVDVDKATLSAAFPGGVSDVLRFWSETLDRTMAETALTEDFQTMRIRDKITALVRARLDAMSSDKEAARRAAALLAAPPNGPLAARMSWSTADAAWRALDDKSTDFNFYTKRAILTGVLTSTFARWLSDDSEDRSATDAFLDARIENVMQIEKAKAKLRKIGINPAAPVGWLAKLRYPHSN
ncbi:MAG: COQ9 family protein [Pseudomonadota bacterium]